MKNLFFTVFSLIIISWCSYPQELRGTWIARNSFSSKEALAYAMDSLAANNFNVVYVNVWSRGYPLWKSQLFYDETGYYIDPEYQGRDILAEAVAEAHKHGLHIEAWFEYGFVGGWTGNNPPGGKGAIFVNHPNWVAKKQNGEEKDGSNFYWMVQTRRDVQDFLIGLCTEIVRNYDIDGIELDRIRYSSLEYGYDAYTDSLYRTENNNTSPPENYSDTSWIRWRANKLNDFSARIYQAIKQTNPKINVSNAPSLYSSSSYTSYQSYCQDWVSWVKNGYIDNVQIQSYVSSLSSFSAILDYAVTLTGSKTKIFPAFAVAPNGNSFTLEQVKNFINTIRTKGFNGTAIWYYSDLINYFPGLKSSVFSDKNYPPFSTYDWREYYRIKKISDTTFVKKQGSWTTSTIPGYSGSSVTALKDSSNKVQYYFDVPVTGYYEVYMFNVVAVNRTDSARVRVYFDNRDTVLYINQNQTTQKRWVKLGDFHLTKGTTKVFEIIAAPIGNGTNVSADAGFISLNRRLSPVVTDASENNFDVKKKSNQIELSAFPNPFNSTVLIEYNLPLKTDAIITLHNITGEILHKRNISAEESGSGKIQLDTGNLAGGVYFCRVAQLYNSSTIKIL